MKNPFPCDPPRGVLGKVVPVELLLARHEALALAVWHLVAYPTGFTFAFTAFLTGGSQELRDRDFHSPVEHGAGKRKRTARLRFEVAFADGTRALAPEQDPNASTRMRLLSASADDHRWDYDFWVSPLPPEGPVGFLCQWPAQGIEDARAELDAGRIVRAAKRARVVLTD